MASANYTQSLTVAGLSMAATSGRTASSATSVEEPLPAGQQGALSGSDLSAAGTITLTAAPTVAPADSVDLYWDGGTRRGVTVASVTDNAITVSGGDGDNMPADGALVTISKRIDFLVAIDGDNASVVGINILIAGDTEDSTGQIELFDIGAATVGVASVIAANTPKVDLLDTGVTNPYAGNPIESGAASTSSTLRGAVLQIGVLQDATP